jgi:hypothetical protein
MTDTGYLNKGDEFILCLIRCSKILKGGAYIVPGWHVAGDAGPISNVVTLF